MRVRLAPDRETRRTSRRDRRTRSWASRLRSGKTGERSLRTLPGRDPSRAGWPARYRRDRSEERFSEGTPFGRVSSPTGVTPVSPSAEARQSGEVAGLTATVTPPRVVVPENSLARVQKCTRPSDRRGSRSEPPFAFDKSMICSINNAFYTVTRSSLRSSSIREPSDPPFGVIFVNYDFCAGTAVAVHRASVSIPETVSSRQPIDALTGPPSGFDDRHFRADRPAARPESLGAERRADGIGKVSSRSGCCSGVIPVCETRRFPAGAGDRPRSVWGEPSTTRRFSGRPVSRGTARLGCKQQ